jgi:mono/diheme cytochrome c family protein
VTSRQAAKLRFLHVFLSVLAIAIILSRDAAAQSTKSTKTAKSAKAPPCADAVTTRSGVYTSQQAARGRDVYLGNCKSCHTPESHTGAAFHATWNKRSLSDLYAYMRERMPKNDPGALSDQEYADVLAYVLKMNRMPAGKAELPTDAAAIKRIRIDVPKGP